MAFVTPNLVNWLEREIGQWVHHEGLIRRPIAPWTVAVPRSYNSLPLSQWFVGTCHDRHIPVTSVLWNLLATVFLRTSQEYFYSCD